MSDFLRYFLKRHAVFEKWTIDGAWHMFDISTPLVDGFHLRCIHSCHFKVLSSTWFRLCHCLSNYHLDNEVSAPNNHTHSPQIISAAASSSWRLDSQAVPHLGLGSNQGPRKGGIRPHKRRTRSWDRRTMAGPCSFPALPDCQRWQQWSGKGKRRQAEK